MDLEIRRQFLHYFFGCLVILLVGTVGVVPYIFINIGVLAIGFSLSLMIKRKAKTFLVHDIVKLVGRQEEAFLPGKGALSFFAGTLAISFLFYNNLLIVLGALVVLVFGDSIATVAGKKFGSICLPNRRSAEGTVAGILVSAFYLWMLFPLEIALLASTGGMLAELLEFEDNLTIPLGTGIVLWFLV